MAKENNLFVECWVILKNNKILFTPNLIMFFINLILTLFLLYLTGLGEAILQNNYLKFEAVVFTANFLIWVLVYILVSLFIDNFFVTMKYGLIKDVILKKRVSLKRGFDFAKEHYFTTLLIHLSTYLLIFVPLILLGVLLFFLLPINSLLAMTLFLPLVVVYLVYITIRLLFVYPVMSFEKEGAYKSLKEDFHFVKAHLHHTIVTWLIVIGLSIIVSIVRKNLITLNDLVFQQLFALGLLGFLLILAVEMTISVWEHVFIFKSYLAGKKIRG